MRCSNCGIENAAGSQFCNQCGTPFYKTCPKCGAQNACDAKFCSQCGASLEPRRELRAEPQTGERDPAGERRHLTVLFCDLVGSTEIAARLDPEEWREIVAAYHRAATEAITGYGGYVAQYQGDGVMAYFGWPEAHDNNAERAGRAGLAIIDAVSKLNEHSTRPKLSARVGIDSGAVVVGAGASKSADVFGDTPNIAARVQAAALSGKVLITADTRRLISGLFVVEDCGAQVLKGIERPLRLYRLIRPSGARGRVQAAAAARELTSFVGRDDELRLLMTRWERAIEGEGQVVLISGEGGIGKSRLVQRFHQQIGGRPHNWFEAAAAPFFQNTPLYPIGEMLQELQAQQSNEPSQGSDTALAQGSRRGIGLSNGGGSNGHSANRSLFAKEAQRRDLASPAELNVTPQLATAQIALNLTTPVGHPASAQAHRRLLSTLATLVLDAAHVLPVVLAIEDLHWADASTLELVHLLVEHAATAPLLLLCTARPEFRAQWPLRSHVTQIALGALSVYHTRTMVEKVAAQQTLSEETVATVVERTGGVPLFIEELTRAVLESGNLKPALREIPATLHDSLMARLDRLGWAKEVIQVGAVIGNEFSYELLHAVHPISEQDLQAALRSATDAELVHVRGIAPDATYQFKHALIHDAAYEALLRSHRRELHRLVARTIDEKFPSIKDAHPEVLAYHWTEAGEIESAIAEWDRAGRGAWARGAFKEALESARRALAMLNLIPESAERDFRELQLTEPILSMLWMTRGPSSHETMEALQRATALAEKGGKLASLVGLMVTAGMSALYGSRDMDAILTLADQALELAVREGSPHSLLLAHSTQMLTCYLRGDLAGTEKHFAAQLDLADEPGIRQKDTVLLVQAFATAAMNAWMLGRADLARQRSAEMAATTNANNPYEVAMSRLEAANLQIALREYKQAAAFATQGLELSEKHQFALLAAASKCILGRARAELDGATEGSALLREGIADCLEIDVPPQGFNKMWLATAQAAEGAIAEAMETVEQTLQENPGQAVLVVMTLRLRGELRMKRGQSELAEADFREAIALARSMGAKALELRATMSLARMLASKNHREEARTMLTEIYNWFTEGFDTADLKDAKALLDELAV